MMHDYNRWLAAGGCLSLLAALMHVGVILGGPAWYRFFGAGEAMAQMAEQGMAYPAVLTAGIALLLTAWGAYAFSGAGLLRRLPLLRTALVLITAVYLVRGLGGFALPFVTDDPRVAAEGVAFWMWSSGICTAFGIVHLVGVARVYWPPPRSPVKM